MKTRRTRIVAAALAACGLALALVFGESASAFAQDGIVFSPNKSVVYGQSWDIGAALDPESGFDDDYGQLTLTTAGEAPVTLSLADSAISDGAFTFFDDAWNPRLGVGTHAISAEFTGGSSTAASMTPVTVTITPAPIAITTTIVQDPNNSQNAIITSELTGSFIDQVGSCGCGGSDYTLPAGTWNLTVKDSNGKAAFERQENQANAGGATFVNYWRNVPSGGNFTATSTFTPTASAKADFTLSSKSFSWTAAQTTGIGGVVPASSTPVPKTVKATPFALPTGIFVAVLSVAVLLIALDIVLIVRRRRRSTPTHPTTPAAGGMYS